MKILAISGSSRNKNTNYMLKTVLNATGSTYDLINLKEKDINPCVNCKGCHEAFECSRSDDMQEIYKKLIESDIILLGSPTYYDNVSGIMKNFMDRCLPFYFSEELKNKKVALFATGGFKSLIDYNEKDQCVWCKNGDVCEKSVLGCVKCLKIFSEHLGMDVISKIHTFHGDPESKKKELIELGKKIAKIK